MSLAVFHDVRHDETDTGESASPENERLSIRIFSRACFGCWIGGWCRNRGGPAFPFENERD